MDSINIYRQAAQQIVERYASYQSGSHEIHHELVMDTVRDHYEVLVIGWQKGRRVYHTMMHFDIIESKIWIQVNNTDRDLSAELIELGVLKDDIVIAFHPEGIRRHLIPAA
ncbi:XisI protein [Spirosoma panaciterrae]|uniref:XisI protein n=1 Tax=Spirosoma panaciterrae TaxID=496058 RepID=UPI00047550EC|nr:XisI protein [Spirosoma panaciterrae]